LPELTNLHGESFWRSPEEQEIIDRAIGSLMLYSVEQFPGTPYRVTDEESKPTSLFIHDGRREAVIFLAVNIDESKQCIDKVASFFAEGYTEDELSHPPAGQLRDAHRLALKYGVSREVGEKIVAAEVALSWPAFANVIANLIVRRNLSDSEVIAMVNRHIQKENIKSNEHKFYLKLARDNGAYPSTIEYINQVFKDRLRRRRFRPRHFHRHKTIDQSDNAD
jgi:hypothetical protein